MRVGNLLAGKRIKEDKEEMLIHKLTKFIVNNADNNVILDVGDHPFSGIADSQVILIFKKQRLKISVVQMTEK